MKLKPILILVVAAGCSSPQVHKVDIPKTALVALSKVDHTLVTIDPRTSAILSKVKVGPDPHEVVVTADGTQAFVSNTQSGKGHVINVIDLVEQKPLYDIDTEALIGPHGMVLVNGKLWFTAEGAKSIARFDPASKKVDLILGVGERRTHMLKVSADEKTVYASNVDSGTISIFENLLLPPPIPPIGAPLPGAKPQMGWTHTLVKAGKGAEGFDLSPDAKELWTANAHAGTITIIDLLKKNVKQTVTAKALGISRVAFTPNGKHVLITSLRTGDLLVFEAKTRKLIKKVNLGKGAAHILVEASGDRAFISCTPAHYVFIFDLNKMEVQSHLYVGDRPDGMDWAIKK